jgi:hypothetical protein
MTTLAPTRVQIPHGHVRYDHQREANQAFHEGARRMIWRWHRQGGKGKEALAITAEAAWARPATYMLVSPTAGLCRGNFWDAIDPDSGVPYLT